MCASVCGYCSIAVKNNIIAAYKRKHLMGRGFLTVSEGYVIMAMNMVPSR